MSFRQDLEEARDKLDELSDASHQNIDNVLKQYFNAINPISDVGETLVVNLPEMDFEEWYQRAMDSRGGMVGSGRLEWPINTEERLSLQYQLIQSMANGSVDISDFAFDFTHQGGQIDHSNRAFVSQVFVPFHKDMLRVITPYVQDLENGENSGESSSGKGTVYFTTPPVPTSRTVVLSSAALLDSIATYKEKIRGDNYLRGNHPEHAANLLVFLEELHSNLETLIAEIPAGKIGSTVQDTEEIKSWCERFWPSVQEEFQKYTSPEAMAKAAVPAAIVLGASALGLLIGGGAVGAMAGGLIGNIIVGHSKPKALTDKIEKALQSDVPEPPS